MSSLPAHVLQKRRKVLFAILAAFSGLGLALGVGELAFRIWRPQNLSGSWRILHSSGLMLNKAGGGARHQFGERIIQYRFNSLNQRGPAIPANSETVLCLGDSFTFGWLLAEEHTFVARLNELCSAQFPNSRYFFANAGAGGWGIADYTAYLELFGPKIQPRKVVVFFNYDDINRALNSTLFHYRESDGIAVLAPNSRPLPVPLKHRLKQSVPCYQFLLEHSHLVQAWRHRVVFGGSHSSSESLGAESPSEAVQRAHLNQGVALAEGLFRRLHSWCLTHNSDLLVVTTGWNFGSTGSSVEWSFLSRAEPFFAELGVPFFDTGKVFTDQQFQLERFAIPGDGHPNEEGARRIAIECWKFLKPRLMHSNESSNTAPN